MGEMGDRDRSKERQRRSGRPSDSGRDRSPDRDRRSAKSSNCRVYVSNIPYECRWQDLKDIFRNEVGDVQFVELFIDENEKLKGTGIVEFSDQQSVKKCLEVMQGYEIKNRKLVIKDDSGNTRDKYGRIIRGGGGGQRSRDDRIDRYGSSMSLSGGTNKWGNTYGLSPSFLESLHIDVPLCNRVFVANLEYNVDKKKLKDIFRLAGKVVGVDLHTDKDGRSRGFAVVEFDHPVEAVQAISMFHNQLLYDRPMAVRMDRAADNLKLPEGLKGIGMGLGVNGEPLRDVKHNLPSNSANEDMDGGILGSANSVNNSAIQVANALTSSLGSTGLNSLANSSVLQAANLSSLLGNRLASDLGIGNSVGANSLVQNQNPLAALAAVSQPSLTGSASAPSMAGGMGNNLGGGMGSNLGGGMGSNLGGGMGSSLGGGMGSSLGGGMGSNSGSGMGSNLGGGMGSSFGGGMGSNLGGGGMSSNLGGSMGGSMGGFSRNDNVQDSFNSNSGYGSRNFSDYDKPKGGYGNDDYFKSNNTSIMNSQNKIGGGGGFSNKVLVTNLPPTASYKMLLEKFNEFGDVQNLEEKGSGIMLIIYRSDWHAERAIRNLDRARVDGRTIEARSYY